MSRLSTRGSRPPRGRKTTGYRQSGRKCTRVYGEIAMSARLFAPLVNAKFLEASSRRTSRRGLSISGTWLLVRLTGRNESQPPRYPRVPFESILAASKVQNACRFLASIDSSSREGTRLDRRPNIVSHRRPPRARSVRNAPRRKPTKRSRIDSRSDQEDRGINATQHRPPSR